MNHLSTWSLENFYLSFYVWWVFFVSLALGALFFVLIHFATKAAWSVTLRRIAENVSLTMPVLFLLGIVCYLGRHEIFEHWLSPESFADPVLQQKRWYLNGPFFVSRSLVYLTIFSVAAVLFARRSFKQDAIGGIKITHQLEKWSYSFLILCGFSTTFAAFDWIMSLNPHWYSTIFGLYFFAGAYVAFMSFLSVMIFIFRSNNPKLARIFNLEHVHDLGKQVFGYSCFWAYAAFAQYLLIWYGNLPEETMWYAVRQSQGWSAIWTLLCLGHFVVPFLFLMSRLAKRTPVLVCAVGLWVLAMHYIDIYWLIIPNFSASGPLFSLMDVAVFALFSALFLAIFVPLTKKRSLYPSSDPRLEESLHYENI